MDEGMIALISALTSSGVATVIVACLNRKWSKEDHVEALVEANKVLMIDKVRYLGKKYITEGEIHLEDKENLLEMYNAYKRLGGNGHLDTIINEVNRLKVI